MQAVRSLAVAIVQCALVLSLAGKYAWDREHLPRAWVKTRSSDRDLVFRGRYLSLPLELNLPNASRYPTVRLAIHSGELVSMPAPPGEGWTVEPLPFFIPEHAPKLTSRQTGEELWVEVSVPVHGAPRPLRLAIRKGGEFQPLDLR